MLPPVPFGLTTSTQFGLIGFQQISPSPEVPAEQRGSLSWSSTLGTYEIALADLGSGRLVHTFAPSNNPVAFSIVKADGSVARVYVTLRIVSKSVGEIYWSSANGVQPYVYAHAYFGVPVAGSLPTTGTRAFTTGPSPESLLKVDFGRREVSGTVTIRYLDAWGTEGPNERATLEPAELNADGSFAAVIAIPGASEKGELRGRLLGANGDELAVFWEAPVRDGYDQTFVTWMDLGHYQQCTTCP